MDTNKFLGRREDARCKRASSEQHVQCTPGTGCNYCTVPPKIVSNNLDEDTFGEPFLLYLATI